MPTATTSTPRPTGRQVAGGLGALAILILGLVGIPIILATVIGWPLPHHVPSGGGAAHALRASIPNSFWPRLFATLAWLAWAYFVFSVMAGLATQFRGRRPGRHPRLFASSAVSALIAAILILGQLRAGHTARTGPLVQPVPVVRLVAQPASATVPSTLPPVSATRPTTVTHTVVPGDTLWSIAVRYYGEGTQWPVIYQANVGLPQSGGGALTDAHWIYPGWSLTIPGVTESMPVVPTPPATASIPPTSPPTTSPRPAALTAPHSDHETASQPSSVGRNPVPQRTSTHSVSSPRVDTRSTPEHHPHHTDRAGGAPTRRPPLVVHRPAGSTSSHTDRSQSAHKTRALPPASHRDEVAPLAIGAGLFGLAAIGLVTALDGRRRRQIGRRSFGRHIPRPEPKSPLADLELQLRHYARAGQVFWLDHLAEILTHAARVAGVVPPEVAGVELGDQGLDVLVTSESADPPSPFERRADRSAAWHLPFTVDPAYLDDAVVAPAVPLILATVGQGTGGTVLVNVDHYRSIHMTVDAERVEGTLAAIATELAATTAPTGTTVMAVGLGYGVIDRLKGGVVVDDLDEALGLLRDGKTVVLVDPEGIADPLLHLAHDASNLHLITAGPIPPIGTAIVIDPASPSLDVHNLDPVQPSHVSDDTLEEVQTLFELAEDDSNSVPQDGGEVSEPNPSSDVLPIRKITLTLLGEPSISVNDGDPRDLIEAVSPTAGTKARRVVQLLVYLAVHDGTATRGEWLTDVSPDKALSDGYVRNLVLLTRRSLEAITGDSDLLAYDKATQRFTLADLVSTDWREFQLAASGQERDGLRSALILVSGVPFGTNPDPWTSAGGLSYVMADDISDAARTLGELALADDDPQLATWAARQGQLANRYDQGLWRILLRTAVDREGLQRIWGELCALTAIDGDSVTEIDPTTADLYDDLVSGCPPAAEVVVLQDDEEIVIPTRHAV